MMDVTAEEKRPYWTEARIAHTGKAVAFLAFFGAVYVVCASVALGFDVVEALQINLLLVGAGLVTLIVTRARTVAGRVRRGVASSRMVPAWAEGRRSPEPMVRETGAPWPFVQAEEGPAPRTAQALQDVAAAA